MDSFLSCYRFCRLVIYGPSTLGGGNQIVLAFGHASLPIIMIIGLFVLRSFFSMISYGGGLPGGIFLPILTLGALIGSFDGNIMVDFGMDPNLHQGFRRDCHGWLFHSNWKSTADSNYFSDRNGWLSLII